MYMLVITIALGAFIATLLGGLFAIKQSDKLHLILGFSAGALLGVALFDLLPEAINIGEKFWNIETVVAVLGIGFIIYMILDRSLFIHCHEEGHDHKGRFGAGSLSFHSFLDGVGIGVAFQVSPAVGLVAAVAVLTHDFSDGINTVSMIFRHGGDKKRAMKWLLTDAIAPVIGVLSTFIVKIPESDIGLVLALFCGFFLYIGASDLLPESHHNHPTYWTTIATALGMAVIYMAVHFAGL